MHHIQFSQIFGGAVLYGAAAYAARTVPVPTNPWARWLIGILQFMLSNVEKGMAALPNSPTESK